MQFANSLIKTFFLIHVINKRVLKLLNEKHELFSLVSVAGSLSEDVSSSHVSRRAVC